MWRTRLVALGIVVSSGVASLTAVAASPLQASAAISASTPSPSPSATRKATAKPKPKVTKKATRKPTVKPTTAAPTVVNGYTVVALAKRIPMPVWSGAELLSGHDWSTRSLVGATTVVNFWASWCPSCKEEWQALQDAAAARPLAKFYAVDTMDRRGAAEDFVNAHPSTFPVIFDERSVLQMSFTTVPNRALPFTVVLDAKGRIAAWKSGPTTAAALQAVLDSKAI